MSDTATLGLYGLGTMGSALSLNILENGFALHVTNREVATIHDFVKEAANAGLGDNLSPSDTLTDLVAAMTPPRAIIMMIPLGQSGGCNNRNPDAAADGR